MLCCSLLLALSALALAQSGRKAQGQGSSHKSEEGFTVSVRTEEVILPITVRDSLGRLVPGLGAQDFFIYDNGQRQQVENFNRRRIPVHVLFLLDASRSVFERMEVIRRAALSFVKTLAPEDRVAVLQFADQVHTLQDWTGNDDDIRHALSWKYRPGQATAFYDALVAAAEKLRQVEGRRAIILLTDGLNTKGHASFAQGLEAVRRAEATVYVVSETEAQARLLRRDTKGAAGLLGRIFGGPYQAQAEHYLALLESAERELAMLADASGGRLYLPLEERDLARAYEEVAEELKTQYIITYVPTSERPSAEAYHQIEVLVRGGYQAHTRRGYYKQQQ
jgi:VWFA-related protein